MGLKRLWANIFGTATNFRSWSVRYRRKTLVWYFGEVLDPHIKKNTTVCGMKQMKLGYWCLEGYEVYFNGHYKSSSVYFGTPDLMKQIYANLHIFDCKREDLKTSVFRGSLFLPHLAESNSYLMVCFSFQIFCSCHVNLKSFCAYSMEFFHYAWWRPWCYVFILHFLP